MADKDNLFYLTRVVNRLNSLIAELFWGDFDLCGESVPPIIPYLTALSIYITINGLVLILPVMATNDKHLAQSYKSLGYYVIAIQLFFSGQCFVENILSILIYYPAYHYNYNAGPWFNSLLRPYFTNVPIVLFIMLIAANGALFYHLGILQCLTIDYLPLASLPISLILR